MYPSIPHFGRFLMRVSFLYRLCLSSNMLVNVFPIIIEGTGQWAPRYAPGEIWNWVKMLSWEPAQFSLQQRHGRKFDFSHVGLEYRWLWCIKRATTLQSTPYLQQCLSWAGSMFQAWESPEFGTLAGWRKAPHPVDFKKFEGRNGRCKWKWSLSWIQELVPAEFGFLLLLPRLIC